jgi:hypothetical protein
MMDRSAAVQQVGQGEGSFPGGFEPRAGVPCLLSAYKNRLDRVFVGSLVQKRQGKLGKCRCRRLVELCLCLVDPAFPCCYHRVIHPCLPDGFLKAKNGKIISLQVFLFHETNNVHIRTLLAPFHNSILNFQRHPKKRSRTIPAAVLTER